MKCKNCTVVVPSEFEFAFSQNVCPKCGNKLLADDAMKMYVELKKRLREVELVMDQNIVYERIALFMVNNYNLMPIGNMPSVEAVKNSSQDEKKAIEEYKTHLISILEEDADLTPEQIREQESNRAQELAASMDDDLEELGDEAGNSLAEERVQRLKKIAAGNKSGGFSVRRVSQ